MGIGPFIINVVWYLPATAIVFAVFYLLWWLGLRICRIETKRAKWGSLPVFMLLVALLVLIPSRPADVFTSAFGFAPPGDVSGLMAQRYLVGQSGGCFLRFTADANTVAKIVARGLSPTDTNQLYQLATSGDWSPPKWWKLQELGWGVDFYSAIFTNTNSYDFVFEKLAYNPATKMVFFQRRDVD
ncbi:MAG: hypothetical protein U1F83_06470 [Verrucomicrobiota bacterium]